MTDEAPRKTLAEYAEDRTKLGNLRAPRMRMTYGDDRDIAYQQEMSLNYALDMIGHLLERIEQLEKRGPEDDGDDIPMSGGIEGPFDPNNRPWEQQ